MAAEHEIELFVHCAEDCAVEETADGYALSRDGIRVEMKLPAGGTSEVLRGSLAPMAGWVSRGFDRREPAATIVWRARLAGSTLLRTAMWIRG
jgi:hypothetical protein